MTTSNVVKSDLYKLHNIVQNSAIVYPKELILSTLKEYFSEELNSKYNAIYRTIQEYDELYGSILGSEFNMIENNFMLSDESRNRKETSQYYWIFKKNIEL